MKHSVFQLKKRTCNQQNVSKTKTVVLCYNIRNGKDFVYKLTKRPCQMRIFDKVGFVSTAWIKYILVNITIVLNIIILHSKILFCDSAALTVHVCTNFSKF